MPIETNNLKILASERIKTDANDGGGKNSGREIIDGESNNLFNDISEMDRTTGKTSIQKIYAAVHTDDTDPLMGATVFISKVPDDPNVSAALFSTESWDDERTSAKNRIENYLAKGAQIAGTPLDTHWQGMKMLQVAMWPQESECAVGQAIVLISNEGKSNQVEQYNRVTEVAIRTAILMVDGKQIEYKIVTYQLSEALSIDFIGLSDKQWYNGQKSTTIIRDTMVADTGKYVASVPLAEDANVGDYTAVASGVYTQLVPSAQTETPMINVDAAGQATALVKARDSSLTHTFNNVVVGTTVALYIGSSIMPKTLSFDLFGSNITDLGGELKNTAGQTVGTIDYQNGVINWTANAGTGTTNLALMFTPAAKVTAPVESMAIQVTQENNSFIWIRNLVPLPSPGTLSVSYVVQDQVYTLRDDGSGSLKGLDSRFGSGIIDYETGTMVLNVAELADVGSAILMTWSNTITAQDRSDLPVSKAYVEIPVNDSIVPGTLQVTWLLNGVSKIATDNGSGQFTGDATGEIDYVEGLAKLEPALLPNGGTTFNVTAQKGAKQSVSLSATPSAGSLTIELSNGAAPLVPRSVRLRVPLSSEGVNGEIELKDVPTNATTGRMVDSKGATHGSINYTTRTMVVSPTMTAKTLKDVSYLRNVNPGYVSFSISVPIVGTRSQYVNKTLGIGTSSIGVSVSYRDESAASTYTATIVASQLKIDLTEGFAEQIIAGSVRFTFGNSIYIDKIGSLYRNPSQTTGAGEVAGQIHYGNGSIELSAWDVSAANNPSLNSLATHLNPVKTNQVSYRAPMVPIRAQSLTLSATKVEGGVLNITPGANGEIDTADCEGFFNFEQGYGQFIFRQKVQITNENRAEIMAESWYEPELEWEDAGSKWINKPIMVLPETIKYSAVGYSYIPIDEDLLGLSAVRLPIDGRVPIFRAGEIAIISSTKMQELPSHVAGTTFDLNDSRIAWCELTDSDGVKIDYDLYEVDYDYGRVTLGGDFVPGNLAMPLIAEYRYQDMRLIKTVKINGELTFTKPLSHNYDLDDTIVGSVLVIGDMQARYTNLFEQETWNNVWSDVPTGAAISARYNDILYPISMTNRGSAQERWALVFTDTTSFRCIGEIAGELTQRGTITEDFAPINPATGAPYFTIKKEGWGAGWKAGNTVRLDTIGANFPIWVIRTVKQSEPTFLTDNFQVMLRGDIDRNA